jgi:hypothetical protein
MLPVAFLSTNLGTVEKILAPPTRNGQVGGCTSNFFTVSASNDMLEPPVATNNDIYRSVAKEPWRGFMDPALRKCDGHGQKNRICGEL